MKESPMKNRKSGLESLGIRNVNSEYWNLSSASLYEQALRRREGLLANLGPLVVRTGSITGRSPNDKFIVKEDETGENIWWGDVNRSFKEDQFDRIFARLRAYIQGGEIFIQDVYAGSDKDYRVPIRVISEYAWHSLFVRNMFITVDDQDELLDFEPQYTIIDLPKFHADP